MQFTASGTSALLGGDPNKACAGAIFKDGQPMLLTMGAKGLEYLAQPGEVIMGYKIEAGMPTKLDVAENGTMTFKAGTDAQEVRVQAFWSTLRKRSKARE